MALHPQLIARLSFVAPFIPGFGPVAGDFRAECDFGIVGMRNMVRIELEPASTSMEAMARIWLASPELQAGRLKVGFPFVVYAGSQLVANGKIETIYDGELQGEA
jgi:hypothetical protein